MVAQHYRWDFYGLSTDSKPDATNPKVANGSTFYEANTSKLYVWYIDQWYEKTATGGGGSDISLVALTQDEYDALTEYDANTLYIIKPDEEPVEE